MHALIGPTKRRAAGAAGLVTALVAVTAGAAKAPLSGATAINARSAAAPATALYLLIVGAGLTGLAVLAAWLWPGRRRRDEDELEPEHHPPQMHWLWKLVGLLLPCALGAALMAAAVVGTGTATHPPVRPSGPPGARPPAPGHAPESPAGSFAIPGWLPWTILAIVLVGMVVAAGLTWLRTRQVLPGSQAEEATESAIGAAIGALDAADDPRQGVIAAYVAMQRTFAAHGVSPGPSESAREYLRRLLLASRATQEEATRLTGLFEEARFSTHPMTQRIRDLALEILTSLRARIGSTPDR